MRLREVRPGDQRTLTGFDRGSARVGDPQVGGYRHWATHRGHPSPDGFHFAIETLHNRTLVGSVWVETDPFSGRFSYGIGIGPQHRRCGYAADAVALLLAFMFGRCRYRACEVSVNGSNFASLSLHGELGFREEARLRDAELLRGEIKYPVLMSITAEQFAARAAVRDQGRSSRGRHWRVQRPGRHRRVAFS
ncbi:GNAT family N-acetyltransferase [Amycolatopsis sp. WGS_07]|uniref:GNAT family N-acetyltransferase n=1 Tax=Amycolatopsis sp. WGS_07 TaxID=3076764 RepID=UPI003872A969